MSALVYLALHKAKNRIKEVFHRPAELVILILGVAFVFFCIWTGNLNDGAEPAARSGSELQAIILAVYALVFVLTAKSGFVNGASMFTMADVNLTFPSPFQPKTLLSFGLFSQMGRSLMLGVFILYQYTWMHDAYGVSLWQLLVVLLGYAMTVFLSQMLAMLLYTLTSGSDSRCRAAKGIFYGILACFVLYLGCVVWQGNGALLDRVIAAANSVPMHFFPVAGFLRFGVVGALTGQWMQIWVALAAFAGCIALYYILVSVLHTDYYEDVLKATEVAFSAITARKEGKAQELAPRNVKVGKTGFSRGEGAAAIAEKHKIENRRSRFFLFDLQSLIFALVTLAFAFFTKEPIGAFAFSVYMMILTVGTGRWARELVLPYVYLIPEPPFKKLLFTLKEQLPALAAQSVLTFVLFPPVTGCSAIDAIGMMTARFGFGLLFIGVNLLMQRLLGGSGSKALFIVVYFLFCMLAALPAVALSVLTLELMLLPQFAMYFIMFAVNLLVSLLLLFCSRNVLEIAQHNNK